MYAAPDDNTGFDEPEADEKQSQQRDSNAIAITQDMGRVQNALSEFDRVAAGLAEIESRYPKDAIYAVETTKGMKDAVEHRAAWRDPRITVEKARKMAKAPLLALGKSIDARAAWITEKLREGEEPIDQLIKAEEARKEDERQARANAEAGRIIAIQEALAEIGQDVLIAAGKTSADIQALLDRMNSTQPDPLVFQEMVDQARAAWSAGIAKLETALKAKLWDEAEQKRIADERAAEAERRAAEIARVAAEQAEQAARLAVQQKAMDEQMAAIAAQQKVLDDAKAAEAARLQREAEEAAMRARDEEARAKRDADLSRQAADATQSVAPAAKSNVVMEAFHKFDAETRAAAEAYANAPAPVPEEIPSLTLGQISQRLGFTVTSDFLASLGFLHTQVKASKLYRESQFKAICAGISAHVLAVAHEHLQAA